MQDHEISSTARRSETHLARLPRSTQKKTAPAITTYQLILPELHHTICYCRCAAAQHPTLQAKSIYVALPTASAVSTEFAALYMPMSIIPSPIAITIVGRTMSTISRASACTFRLRTARQSNSHSYTAEQARLLRLCLFKRKFLVRFIRISIRNATAH